MAEQELPEYLVESDDGLAIELKTAVEIDGAQTKTVIMREPTVRDQLDVQAVKGSEAHREVTLMANLCNITPGQVEQMTMRNYRRLQEALEVFTQ